MLLSELAKQPLMARARVRAPGFDLRAVHCDSRRAGPQVGFFALAGLREDGHRYLESALAAGAPALFVTDAAAYGRLEAGAFGSAPAAGAGAGGIFLVEGGRAGLARLASLLWEAPSRRLELLGVTGTNGKTTVAHLTRQLSGAVGRPCGEIGTLGLALPGEPWAGTGALRTTPEAPDVEAFLARCLAGGVGRVAMEATSIGIALERTRELVFHGAAFTNLTRDHLDFHGTLEAYQEAKFRLFLHQELQAAVVNLADPAGRDLARRLERERPAVAVTGFSIAGEAALRMEQVEAGPGGVRGVVAYEGARHPFATGLAGAFNLANLLAALGLLLTAGESLAPLAGAVAGCRAAPGRFERVAPELPFTVVVDYAHTPDALANALRAAAQAVGGGGKIPGGTGGPGRVLLLFGCGGERDREKRPLMATAAEKMADLVVLTSDNPRGEDPEAILAEIATGLGGGGAKIHREVERARAIRWLLEQARPGDFVLLAGKGHETYQETAGQRTPFDDREQVRHWAGAGGAEQRG